jgi:hypothetical protein
MDNRDRAEFGKIVLLTAENFSAEVSKAQVELVFRMLERYSLDEVRAGFESLIRTRVYKGMPTTAEIIQAIEGNVEDRAQIEADKVYSAIVFVGRGRSVVFDDPTTAAVILQGFGGWSSICRDNQGRNWLVKEFANRWASYKRQGIEANRKLVGDWEADAICQGRPEDIEPPILIGDEDKCRRILAIENKEKKQIPAQRVKRLLAGIG